MLKSKKVEVESALNNFYLFVSIRERATLRILQSDWLGERAEFFYLVR